ncbi:MAG: hypothetical protein HY042_12255 [Spirochaetia bacterium]|nr:hypothetical protein [Spirochaetia bacterium]
MNHQSKRYSVDETVEALMIDPAFAERTARNVIEKASLIQSGRRRTRNFLFAAAAAAVLSVGVWAAVWSQRQESTLAGLGPYTASQLSDQEAGESYWSETDGVIQTALATTNP